MDRLMGRLMKGDLGGMEIGLQGPAKLRVFCVFDPI